MRQLATAEWQELDRRHFLHPFTDFKALAAKGARVIVRADGVYLYDSDGHRILDAMAGLWCVNVGYGRTELADVARAQMLELPYYNSFFQTAHPPAIELARKLVEITPPQFNHVFFAGSGSEANDTVVRMVRRYWDLMGEPERSVIVSRENAYHGSTMAGASLGGMAFMHAQGGLPIPGIVHIRQPYWYSEGGDLSPGEFGLLAARALDEKIAELGAHRVAAFIGEPIQGAGGVIIPPDTYWPEIQRICDRHGILLIADEVICGFGRTGHWFGSERFGIRPDLMPIAKGMSSGYLPIGGVMVGDRVAEVLIARGELAPCLAAKWRALAEHPLVGEARCTGLIGALELVRDKASRRFFDKRGEVGTICRDYCFENGLVMRAVRDTMIVAPPLVITPAQLDELAEKAWRCLDLTLARCRAEGRL
jgi:putrescine aminotransferase